MKQDALVWIAAVMIMCWIAFVGRPFQSPIPQGPGSLVICGGGHLPSAIRAEFLRLAGGPDARIVVIPTATSNADNPEYLERLKIDWHGATILHTRSREVANDLEFVKPLEDATGVWLSGGDQVCLTDAYLGTLVHKELKNLVERGGVIGGTSAGAAVMSDVMIKGGESVAEVGTGFGLLPETVVDQHFIKRNRMGRLAGVVTQRPGILGLGVDEETALVVWGDVAYVLGNSSVLTCSAHGSWFLKPGQVVSLAQLRRVNGAL